MVFPDTSPRDTGIEGVKEDWAFGEGAGFYVDATESKYSKHFRMYSYITKELPEIVNAYFNVDGTKISVMGHSMGGHGALIAGLKNPGKYRSVSAFSPVSNPIKCPWGEKAFKNYLGSVEAGK